MLRTNVGWILNGGWRGQRVHRLAVVIVDCFETVFGDLKVNLADPTGVIRCTVREEKGGVGGFCGNTTAR